MGTELTRRKLLELLSRHALALPLGCLPAVGGGSQANAASSVVRDKSNKFMLYIHFGSADGLTTGMLPPAAVVVDGSSAALRTVGTWSRGLFMHDKEANSINPNVNIHYQDQGKALIFNEYSKVLQPLQDHLCIAVGNSRSLSHHDAAAFQISGARFGNDRGSWVANFAQAVSGNDNFVNVCAAPSAASMRERIYATVFNSKGARNNRVAVLNADSLETAHTLLSDPEGIPHADGAAQQYWQTMHRINAQLGGKYHALRQSLSYYVENLLAGAPELAAGSALRSSIETAVNLNKVKAALNDTNLPRGAVCDVPAPLLSQASSAQLVNNLQLAAGLIGSGRAKGMLLAYGDHDEHGGGSSLSTPRHASILFAAVRIFWEWVVAQGMQDNVMVVISHDFTRTAYNDKSSGTENLKVRQADGIADSSLITKGTDHQQIMSMMFINGKVPSAARIGALADNYVAFGTQGTSGKPDPDIAPYTSDTLVGAMLRRCFDDVFPNEDTLKEYFPGFRAAALRAEEF